MDHGEQKGIAKKKAQDETGIDAYGAGGVFFAMGNTWPLAQAAAEYLNAELFRIQPKTPYTDEKMVYNNDDCRANQEMSDETCRPALAETVPNMEQYDTVILAFPIRWGQAPRIVETFVEAHDLSGSAFFRRYRGGGADGLVPGNGHRTVTEIKAGGNYI